MGHLLCSESGLLLFVVVPSRKVVVCVVWESGRALGRLGLASSWHGSHWWELQLCRAR